MPWLQLLLLYKWEPQGSLLGTEDQERRRNNWGEGQIQLKDPAVGPSEPWESPILFLMYVWSPRQHIGPTYKASNGGKKRVENRWRGGKFGKGWKKAECQVSSYCQHYVLLWTPCFASCITLNHFYNVNFSHSLICKGFFFQNFVWVRCSQKFMSACKKITTEEKKKENKLVPKY